ncbi:MAG: poly-gamma-glutamate system protein [Lachnospiraceae bacterium]|nr:poly-gamma-glutamate system protein [Lachnospiraceae bacterium]
MRKDSKLTKKQKFLLFAAVMTGAAMLSAAFLMKSTRPCALYDIQVRAAEQMRRCMDAVKAEKARRGISLSDEDIFGTGLIGEDFNFITSTSGDIRAKRTSTDPDMAALLVRMLDEASLAEGDVLACSFSGSFPALNIATLCACDAMGIKPVYTASVGASTWGANNPELSSPEMLVMLYEDGLIREAPALITPGGGGDTGRVPDEESFALIWERVVSLGYPVMVKEDFAANVAAKKAIFDADGAEAFLSAGGNITSLGRNMVTDLVGQGLIRERISSVNSDSGLLELYLHEGKPAILLLNIRQMVSDYGIPFDPESRGAIGESAVYREVVYPVWLIAAGLFVEALIMCLYRSLKK